MRSSRRARKPEPLSSPEAHRICTWTAASNLNHQARCGRAHVEASVAPRETPHGHLPAARSRQPPQHARPSRPRRAAGGLRSPRYVVASTPSVMGTAPTLTRGLAPPHGSTPPSATGATFPHHAGLRAAPRAGPCVPARAALGPVPSLCWAPTCQQRRAPRQRAHSAPGC